jgi:hypothetical protein
LDGLANFLAGIGALYGKSEFTEWAGMHAGKIMLKCDLQKHLQYFRIRNNMIRKYQPIETNLFPFGFISIFLKGGGLGRGLILS